MGAAHTSANHQHLSQELSGKVIYDDLSVFNRLRVFDEDATIVADCHKGYKGGRPKEPLRDPSWDSLRYDACV